MSTKDKQLVGAAGEHLVLSRLLSRGYLAAQAPRGVRKADILVNHLDGKSAVLIQVKTRQSETNGTWMLTKKIEDMRDDDLFYCLVDLKSESSKVYVMPSEVLAEVTKVQHATWLAMPGKNGNEHVDTDMRTISNKFPFPVSIAPNGWMDKYLENWDLIG
jgi:hypothetical protein